MHSLLFVLSVSMSVGILLSLTGNTCATLTLVKNVELRQQKLCQLDGQCHNCSLQVEKHLLLERTKLMRGAIEKSEHEFVLTDEEENQLEHGSNDFCAIPTYEGKKHYCCGLWTAFDCRAKVATKKCTFVSFVKYRKNMIQWANDLMLLNICTEFDYGCEECREGSEKLMFSEDIPVPTMLDQNQATAEDML